MNLFLALLLFIIVSCSSSSLTEEEKDAIAYCRDGIAYITRADGVRVMYTPKGKMILCDD